MGAEYWGKRNQWQKSLYCLEYDLAFSALMALRLVSGLAALSTFHEVFCQNVQSCHIKCFQILGLNVQIVYLIGPFLYFLRQLTSFLSIEYQHELNRYIYKAWSCKIRWVFKIVDRQIVLVREDQVLNTR